MKKDAWEIGGKIYEPKETPPSNEQWGTYGFTVSNLVQAESKMQMLINRIKNRPIKNSQVICV